MMKTVDQKTEREQQVTAQWRQELTKLGFQLLKCAVLHRAELTDLCTQLVHWLQSLN
jgi:hypothetical protein